MQYKPPKFHNSELDWLWYVNGHQNKRVYRSSSFLLLPQISKFETRLLHWWNWAKDNETCYETLRKLPKGLNKMYGTISVHKCLLKLLKNNRGIPIRIWYKSTSISSTKYIRKMVMLHKSFNILQITLLRTWDWFHMCRNIQIHT